MLTTIIAWLFVLGPRYLKSQTVLLPIPRDERSGRSIVALGKRQGNDGGARSKPFRLSLEATSLPKKTREEIIRNLVEVGLLSDKDSGPENLVLIAQDFIKRPEVYSSLLMSDFGLPPLVAHQTRAAVMNDCLKRESIEEDCYTANDILSDAGSLVGIPIIRPDSTGNPKQHNNGINQKFGGIKLEVPSSVMEELPDKRPLYKSVIVNKHAKVRRSNQTASDDTTHDYGLPTDYKTRFPTISLELDSFYTFMTRPTTSSQEEPIRPATASVYIRHARQFLGWYAATYNISNDTEHDLSIYKVFPNREKSSADAVLAFILWLRSFRNISVSYEANILRGLTKFLKFRFAAESQSDPSYGEKSFDDIPIIREIRKLHREANKRQKVAPRSSDEAQKWLSWPEYLQVVQSIQTELLGLLEKYGDELLPSTLEKGENVQAVYTPQQRKIATVFQKYLILAIFASVPDRQRTIRELEIGRTFLKDQVSGCWSIKHAPDDYKTGKAYGERPRLQLSEELTPWVDNFLEHWRRCLNPLSEFLFIQARTGKPLTQDSVYQIVSRACYQYTGKKTNPHLLRDMLVTHVRESDASEKQLEALALYMGHSIQMQRTSYDRRTLTTKVAPAVELMQSVNKRVNGDRKSL